MSENMHIFPLFPTLLSNVLLEDNPKFNILEDVKDTVQFTCRTEDINCSTSENRNILNCYPELKNRILEVFYDLKDNVLGHTNTDFAITTSWITKIDSNSSGLISHGTHINSYYSGAFYISEHNPDLTGVFEANNKGIASSQIVLNRDSETEYNSKTFSFIPKKNYLMFFPSYLNHRIINHKCEEPIYVIWFNIMPTSLWQETCELKITIN